MTRPLSVKFTPLVPKKPVVDVQVPNRVSQIMRNAGGNLVRQRRDYPPSRPWKGRTPTTGPRRGGRRTGQLGRGWQVRFRRAGFDVFNRVPYAGYVQGFKKAPKGKRQTAVMASRGWASFDKDIAVLNRTLKPSLRRAFRQRRR